MSVYVCVRVLEAYTFWDISKSNCSREDISVARQQMRQSLSPDLFMWGVSVIFFFLNLCDLQVTVEDLVSSLFCCNAALCVRPDCPVCLIWTLHWPYLFPSLISPPVIHPSLLTPSIPQSVFTFLPPTHSFFYILFHVINVCCPAQPLSCFILFLSSANSFWRCSSQQSCLQQNPAAAQYTEETKASTIAWILCWWLWGAFGW